LANARAFRREALLFPATVSVMRYPACCSSCPSARPSLPGPMIAIVGFDAMAAA